MLLMPMKLYIFDYFDSAKPDLVFANNDEEAIKLVKEARAYDMPAYYFASVKVIDIPSTPSHVDYALRD